MPFAGVGHYKRAVNRHNYLDIDFCRLRHYDGLSRASYLDHVDVCVRSNRYSCSGIGEGQARHASTFSPHHSEELHAASDRHPDMLDEVHRTVFDFSLFMP